MWKPLPLKGRRANRTTTLKEIVVALLLIFALALTQYTGFSTLAYLVLEHRCEVQQYLADLGDPHETVVVKTAWGFQAGQQGWHLKNCSFSPGEKMGPAVSKENCAEEGFYSPEEHASRVQTIGTEDSSLSTSTGFHLFEFRGTGHGTALATGIMMGAFGYAATAWAVKRLGCSQKARHRDKLERGEKLAQLLENQRLETLRHLPTLIHPPPQMSMPQMSPMTDRYLLPPQAHLRYEDEHRLVPDRLRRAREQARRLNADLAGARVTEVEEQQQQRRAQARGGQIGVAQLQSPSRGQQSQSPPYPLP